MKRKLIVSTIRLVFVFLLCSSSVFPSDEDKMENLVVNGDMEKPLTKGSNLPYQWYICTGNAKGEPNGHDENLTWDQTVFASPTHSLKIDDHDTEAYYCWQTEVRPIELNEKRCFTFSFKYKTQAISGAYRVSLVWYSEKKEYDTTNGKYTYMTAFTKPFRDTPDANDFQSFEQVVEAPYGAIAYQIQLVSGGSYEATGIFWLDDVFLAPFIGGS